MSKCQNPENVHISEAARKSVVIFVLKRIADEKNVRTTTASDTSNHFTDKVFVLKIVHFVVTDEMHVFLYVGLSHSAKEFHQFLGYTLYVNALTTAGYYSVELRELILHLAPKMHTLYSNL